MVYAAGMSGGQVLFKMAALRYVADGGVGERLLGLVCNIYFVTALVFYAGYAILWVWILSFTPLSRAYPFVATCVRAHAVARSHAVRRDNFLAVYCRPTFHIVRSFYCHELTELFTSEWLLLIAEIPG